MQDIVDLDSVKRILENNSNVISQFRVKYHFQGDSVYLHLFDALLVFHDRKLFDRVNINMSEFNRLKNAYFWYSQYIASLKKQGIPVGDHEQAKFKIIEEIDRLDEKTDWLFIKEIDELNE